MYINNNTTPLYLKNNTLYIVNESKKPIKLLNNINKYSYIEDDLGYVHICCIDFRGKLTYIKYSNNKPIYKKLIYICNLKNIESIKFNLYNNLLNIFLVRTSDIFHIKYDLIYCTYNKFTLSNLMFNNVSCYIACEKHNLLVLELNYINDNINIENKLFFDTINNSWSSFNSFSLNSNLLNYHKSLKYK